MTRSYSTGLRKQRDVLFCNQVPKFKRVPANWVGQHVEKKKVHVVEIGKYSDRRVVAVVDSARMLQRAKRIYELDENAMDDLESFAINDMWQVPAGYSVWSIAMSKNGDIFVRPEILNEQFEETKHFIYFIQNSPVYNRTTGTYKACDVMRVYVYARNEEHAIKIANERRTAAIALGLWKQTREPIPFPH